MIKRMGLFQRRTDLTATQFSSYWAKKHSPLVLKMPQFKRYTQNHVSDFLPNFTSLHPTFHLDGIAEMYWDHRAQMQQDFEQKNAIDALRQDETEFMSHISVCIVEESELQGQIASIKLMFCLSDLDSNISVDSLLKALPQLHGVQCSTVEDVINRPQLPSIEHLPKQFFSLWYQQYEHVLQDFGAIGWQEFYQHNFQHIQRVSLILMNPLLVRDNVV